MQSRPGAAPRATPTTTAGPHGHREWYKVSTPEYDTVAYDPLDPPKRYHTGIFVETNTETGVGSQFHVTGDIIARNSMRFEVIENYVPATTQYFHRNTEIRWIREADYPRIRGILKALPTPTKTFGPGIQLNGIRLLGQRRTGSFTG